MCAKINKKTVKMDDIVPTSTKICWFFVDLVTILLLVYGSFLHINYWVKFLISLYIQILFALRWRNRVVELRRLCRNYSCTCVLQDYFNFTSFFMTTCTYSELLVSLFIKYCTTLPLTMIFFLLGTPQTIGLGSIIVIHKNTLKRNSGL